MRTRPVRGSLKRASTLAPVPPRMRGATAVATVMLAMSFVLLLVINALQAWQRKRSGA